MCLQRRKDNLLSRTSVELGKLVRMRISASWSDWCSMGVCYKGKVGVMSLWEVGRGVMGGVTEE